ncbi:amidase domain-containing protein [Romboutsia hominis]|uniref:amidase domain-containing protein n=1 Tax=Romboutsia hominis TaxID=1507512 RepID=UPI0023DD17F5|nr:amidase domain-containing protein [Romboutsia hominis]
MLKEYDREKAVAYARKWALDHNPTYANYELYGGDCTNYISQCLRAGNIPFDNIGEHVLKNGIGIVNIQELQLGQQQSLFINM